MARIIVQGFTLIDTNNDGTLEAIEFDFQKTSGVTAAKISTDPQILAFFQKAFDLIKAQL